MGIRFRKRVKFAPGLNLNLSKSGASLSVGERGAAMNFGKRGARATISIPGTGISYSRQLGGGRGRGAGKKPSLVAYIVSVLPVAWLFHFFAAH